MSCYEMKANDADNPSTKLMGSQILLSVLKVIMSSERRTPGNPTYRHWFTIITLEVQQQPQGLKLQVYEVRKQIVNHE